MEIAQENDERSPLAIGKTYNKNIDAKKLDVGDVIEWEENGDLQTLIIEDVGYDDKGFKFLGGKANVDEEVIFCSDY